MALYDLTDSGIPFVVKRAGWTRRPGTRSGAPRTAGGVNDWTLYGADTAKMPAKPPESPGKPRKPRKATQAPTQTEHAAQTALCDWLDIKHPDVLYYAVPNAGKRGRQAQGRALAEGLKAGVPDLCICEARGDHHGLYIELKRERGGTVSPEQEYWLEALDQRGYRAIVCRGFEAAVRAIEDFLALPKTGV